MKILNYWKLIVYIFTIFLWYVFFFIIGYDITKHSPLSPTFDHNSYFVSNHVLTILIFIFSFLIGFYWKYHLEIYDQTIKTYNLISREMKHFAVILKSNEHLISENENVNLKNLKSFFIDLPLQLFDTLENETRIHAGLYMYSLFTGTNHTTKDDKFIQKKYLKLLMDGIKKIDITFKHDESIELKKRYFIIFDRLEEIRGNQLVQHPSFVYITLLILAFTIHTINVPFSLAFYSWGLGTVVIIFYSLVLLFIIDGVKTIVPVFTVNTQGYTIIKDLVLNIRNLLASDDLLSLSSYISIQKYNK